jgi:hypothetical protein
MATEKTTEPKPTISTIQATGVRLAGMTPAYTRHEGIDWDWIAQEPLYIPRGYRLIVEVAQDGDLSVQRQKL